MSESWRVVEGDCVEAMRAMPEASVDSIVCDPPYGLEFMGKSWDRLDGGADVRQPFRGEVQTPDNPYGRTPVRYGYDNAPQTMQTWHEAWAREALRVLKPGGHLLAFGGTRTYHRLACAIEDAGFEIRDCLAWLYGSGFPKSLAVDKAIDRINGKPLDRLREFGEWMRASREAAGLTAAEVNRRMGTPQGCGWWEGKGAGAKWDLHLPSVQTFERLKEMYDAGDEWDWFIAWAEAERMKVGEGKSGAATVAFARESATEYDVTAPATPDAERWQGWGTALKPAHEPIVLARKPLAGTVAGNVLAHGTGALNVDGCRIGATDSQLAEKYASVRNARPRENAVYGTDARERSEGRLEPHEAGRWPANVCLDPEAAAMLDEQTGTLTSGSGQRRPHEWQSVNAYGFSERPNGASDYEREGDSGGASRFLYVAKASSAERNAGLDGFEAQDGGAYAGGEGMPGRTLRDGVWVQTDLAQRRPRANVHPTVKPIELMRWLCRLVTPSGGLILDPFTGSGTTGCAAVLERFRFVGVEREPEYAAIARARIEWWSEHPDGMALVERLEAEREHKARADAGQIGLF